MVFTYLQVRTRVEPKTFFANERTFLSWVNVAVLIMFTALSLLSDRSFFGSRGVGGPTTSQCDSSSNAGLCRASQVRHTYSCHSRQSLNHTYMHSSQLSHA